MRSGTVLAVDQGTSGTTSLVLAGDGRVLASAHEAVRPSYAAGGRVEVEPAAVLKTVLDTGRRAVAEAGVAIEAVGLANQGETVLAWDPSTGEPLTTALVWQDRRASEICFRLGDEAESLRQLTGLPLDAYFAAPKMVWLRERATRHGVVTMIDSWIIHQLTGEFVTDASTASRSLLMDLNTVSWSPAALEVFGLEDESLPRIVDCAGLAGTTSGFGSEIPVTGLAADQQAALFGQRCLEPGSAKCTYGTGAFLLANTGPAPHRSSAGLVSCVAWSLDGQPTYCLDGQVFTVGSAVRWLTDLGIINGAPDIDRVAGTAPDSGGVSFVPALAGLAAPWWSGSARGAVRGLNLDTNRGHIVRSFLDGIAAQVVEVAAAVSADLGLSMTELRVDGGLTQSAVLMQTQADLLQLPVRVFPSADATALGVGALARLGIVGEPDSPVPVDPTAAAVTTYEPQISEDEAMDRMARFRSHVASVIPESER